MHALTSQSFISYKSMPPLPPNSHLTTKTMAPKMNPLLLLLAVLAIASPLLSPASAAEDKPKKITMPLKDICNLTISEADPKPIDEICMSIIQSADDDHHDINDMDVVTALRLSMKAFFAYAKTAVDRVNQLRGDPKLDEGTKTSLKGCYDSYTAAIESMKRVKEEMKGGLGSISHGFSSVSSRTSDCQYTFDEMEKKSVIPEYQEKLSQIAVINLAIANFVAEHCP